MLIVSTIARELGCLMRSLEIVGSCTSRGVLRKAVREAVNGRRMQLIILTGLGRGRVRKIDRKVRTCLGAVMNGATIRVCGGLICGCANPAP